MRKTYQRLFLDCDGVLANFDEGFYHLFGRIPDRDSPTMPPKEMWDTLRDAPDFYANLQPLADAHRLYHAVEHMRPIILTGVPLGGWAQAQKLKWRDKHFPGVPMQTCYSKDKHLFCQPEDILVDDWHKASKPWEDQYGHFVWHRSARESINEINRLWKG